MINKIHFGKRIASLRRKANYSQSELADILNITPQAVSKWECGATLPDIDLLLQLSHIYGVSINQMLEDNDLVFELTGKPTSKDGITYFLTEEDPDFCRTWAKEMVAQKWIKRNWENAYSCDLSDDAHKLSYGHEIVKTIIDHGGTILEIGAGPGGGFVPYILKADPDATIIISDLVPTVVREWKALLDKEIGSPNLYYASFDFCTMPFADCSIDIVSDDGGIGNAVGDKAKALKEAYRVLKPGGILVTSTGFVSKETLAELPKNVQQILTEKRPDIFEDLYEDTVLAGFNKIDSVISGHWFTDEDESGIADLARSLGINLKFTSYLRYCTK